MIKAPYSKDRNYDVLLERLVKGVDKRLSGKENDDFLLICFGATGTGKSSLMLSAYDDYAGDNASMDFIALKREDFAKSLKLASTAKKPRFVGNDEANISKRDALTKFNKDVIDLFFSIRGLNIFHWWNNPSIEMLDKLFIEEKLNGAIFVATKSIDKPRLYYYFRKIDLLKILSKYGNLKTPTIRRCAREFAYYAGWFKDYNGRLKQAYLDKKGSRMSDKIDEFFDKYASDDMLDTKEVLNKLNVSRRTLDRYEKKLIKDGIIVEGEHLIRTPTNRKKYTEDYVNLILSAIENRGEQLA